MEADKFNNMIKEITENTQVHESKDVYATIYDVYKVLTHLVDNMDSMAQNPYGAARAIQAQLDKLSIHLDFKKINK